MRGLLRNEALLLDSPVLLPQKSIHECGEEWGAQRDKGSQPVHFPFHARRARPHSRVRDEILLQEMQGL